MSSHVQHAIVLDNKNDGQMTVVETPLGGDVPAACKDNGQGCDAAETESPHSGLACAPCSRPTTLADVLALVESSPSRERKQVEMKSALRGMAHVLGRPLRDIPADPESLSGLVTRAAPASVGMSKERWSRTRSLTSAALRQVGFEIMPARDIGGFSPAWRDLADTLSTKGQRVGVSRLLSHLTRLGIEPADVSLSDFDGYHKALKCKSLALAPEQIYRSSVKSWNAAVASGPNWPQVTVPLAANPRHYSLSWETFMPAFMADVEAFLANSGNPDVFADDYHLPVKASTVALRRRQIRQIASALAASGTRVEDITSLAVLVDLANAKAALRHLKARKDEVTTTALSQQAWLLATIGKYWVKTQNQVELRAIAARLTVKRKGMTPRNRERLRQFDLDANVDILLALPARVLHRAQRDNLGTADEARCVMLAVAVELELVAPMRVNNLAALEIDRHLVEVGRRGIRNRHIVIPAPETKTGTPFEVMVPPDSANLVDSYVKTYRTRVCASSSPFLFPNPEGERRNTVAFSRAISKFVKDETGIVMHAHLFRQLAAKLHLAAHPNDIETVRRILGHSSAAMTNRAYAEQRSDQSFASYGVTIADLRKRAGRAGIYRQQTAGVK